MDIGTDRMKSSTSLSSGTSDPSVQFDRFMMDVKFHDMEAWMYAFDTPAEFFKFYNAKLRSMFDDIEKYKELVAEFREEALKSLLQQEEIREQDAQISVLDDDVTQLQIRGFEDRKKYLKLIGECEKMKNKNQDDSRKYQAALILGGIQDKDVVHFLQKNPRAPVLTDKVAEIKEKIKICKEGDKRNKSDIWSPDLLSAQVKTLEDQIQQLEIIHQNEIDALKQNLRLVKEERAVERTKTELRAQNMADELKTAKIFIHKAMVDSLATRKKMIQNEEEWGVERSELVKKISKSVAEPPKTCTNNNVMKGVDISSAHMRMKEELARSQTDLLNKRNVIREYEMRFMKMERQRNRLREENLAIHSSLTNDIRVLNERNTSMKNHVEAIENRRKLDIVGYQSELRSIKTTLLKLERGMQVSLMRRLNQKEGPGSVGLTLTKKRNLNSGLVKPKPEQKNCGPTSKTDNDVPYEMFNDLLKLVGERVRRLERQMGLCS